MSSKAIKYFIPVQGAAYVGPGDIVTFSAWWGLRAYSAATAGNNCLKIQRASDNAQQIFTTLANGDLDTASIATFLNATTGKITILYAQIGGSTFDLAATGSAPAYATGLFGSRPGINFVGTKNSNSSAGAGLTQPFTAMFVANRYSGTLIADVLSTSTGNQNGFYSSANQGYAYTGNLGIFTIANSATTNAVLMIHNSTSSILFVNGTKTTGLNFGASNQSGAFSMNGWQQNGTYYAAEAGYLAGAISDGNAATLQTNQANYWV